MNVKPGHKPMRVDFGKSGLFMSFGYAAALALVAAHGQERLPLQMDPEDLQIRIEKVVSDANRFVRIAPAGAMKPSFYRTQNPAERRWSSVPSQANVDWVNHGGLALPTGDSQRQFSAAFADFSKLNGFVRIPANASPEKLTTLVVVLHPSTWGANSGRNLERSPYIAPHLDAAQTAAWFPSAQNLNGSDNWWNGLDGPQASDYSMLLNGIGLCKELLPSIRTVRLYAISQGVGTAIGFAQLYPDKVDGMLLVSGFNNLKTASFVEGLSLEGPFRFKRPIPVVGVVSSRDAEFLPHVRKACEWFASANGFAGTPVTNTVRRDYIEAVKGDDSSVIAYGDNVRFVLNTAADHVDSLNFSTNGNAVLVRRFLADGVLPGGEGE